MRCRDEPRSRSKIESLSCRPLETTLETSSPREEERRGVASGREAPRALWCGARRRQQRRRARVRRVCGAAEASTDSPERRCGANVRGAEKTRAPFDGRSTAAASRRTDAPRAAPPHHKTDVGRRAERHQPHNRQPTSNDAPRAPQSGRRTTTRRAPPTTQRTSDCAHDDRRRRRLLRGTCSARPSCRSRRCDTTSCRSEEEGPPTIALPPPSTEPQQARERPTRACALQPASLTVSSRRKTARYWRRARAIATAVGGVGDVGGVVSWFAARSSTERPLTITPSLSRSALLCRWTTPQPTPDPSLSLSSPPTALRAPRCPLSRRFNGFSARRDALGGGAAAAPAGTSRSRRARTSARCRGSPSGGAATTSSAR